jgi:adenine-specific DNA-methyltransferase
MEWSEAKIIAAALLLGAKKVPGWTTDEERLTRHLPSIRSTEIDKLERKIAKGNDPLGDIFCSLRLPAQRREHGATYTPPKIVKSMLDWAENHGIPSRVVDPGVGSARFIIEAGKRFKTATLLGAEIDPVASILARANLATVGFADRSKIVLGDYRDLVLPTIKGRTLYVGNPPYIRHHLVESRWKEWLVQQATKLGLQASQLAGLHIHFFLSTAIKAKTGDFGSFITAAEWLDVNYGSLLRDLFLGTLGGQRIVVIEPTAMPFPDAITTAAITSFEVGSEPRSVRLKRIETLDQLKGMNGGRAVRRERLEAERRWSHFTRAARTEKEGYIELGELCRVHRGQVTGANKVWIAGEHSEGLPDTVLFSSVTRAKELIKAGLILNDPSSLRRVIDIPVDLDLFEEHEKRTIENFLKIAKRLGANESYTAQNRKAWWSVGLRQPAPILATYMARRPPAFVRNLADARHINIAHGLYPREPLTEKMLKTLVAYLSTEISVDDGRTYAGGLTKFEPREMERIFVPTPEMLRTLTTHD